jgi:AcrR family transcriptional regulator
VSRGIFYHYFRTVDDLREAVATEVGNAMMRAVDPAVQGEADPAVRVSTGVRLVLTLTRTQPYVGAFLSRGGIRALKANSLVMDFLPRDIESGIEAGRFGIDSSFMGVRLVVGPILAVLDDTLAKQQLSDSFVSRFAAAILRSLGIADKEADEIARRPLPHVEPALAIGSGQAG